MRGGYLHAPIPLYGVLVGIDPLFRFTFSIAEFMRHCMIYRIYSNIRQKFFPNSSSKKMGGRLIIAYKVPKIGRMFLLLVTPKICCDSSSSEESVDSDWLTQWCVCNFYYNKTLTL
jgi:hypothetical protein